MARKRSDRPNVVLFFTDQQRWDTTGVGGCPLDLTPNYDRMATEGMHLSNMMTCQPVCGPARSCLQTGMYASNTGVYTNRQMPMNPELKTLGSYFKEGGYTTGYIGKWHLAENEIPGPVKPELRAGYDYWLASNILEFTSNAYDTEMYDGDGKPVKLPGYRVDACTDAAIRYIDEHQDEPFFLTISYIEPHHQNHTDDYPAPDGYAEKYQARWTPPDLTALGGSSQQHLAGYYGMIKRLDEALGRLRDSIKSLGLEEDTVILYTADHGNHFKTRNGEYKRSCHDASIHIPGAITGPGFNGGGRIKSLTSLIDVPPTLLDAAAIPVPAVMQGRSMKPLARGPVADWPAESFTQISEAEVGRCIRTVRWKYSVQAEQADMLPNHQGATRYTEAFLYDLQADPYELKNLVGRTHLRDVADSLQKRLLARMAEVGEDLPEIVPAKPTPAGQGTSNQAAVDTLGEDWLSPHRP